jgi:very-short-patch-repair endonuclease
MSVFLARRLRRQMTAPELSLWAILRQRPGGFKFRRQHPASGFILDFYCRAAGMGIEIDGIAHDMGDNPQRDRRRDAMLGRDGIEILRFSADQIQYEPEAVTTAIVASCARRAPPPPSAVPLPGKSRGGNW